MSAKHKRPFYVFAAVAAVCCMVLVTGVRGSKADDGQSPLIAGSQLTDPAHTLAPIPGTPDSSSPRTDSGTTAGPDPRGEGDFEEAPPSLEDLVSGADGDDTDSGLAVPPFDLPLTPDVDPRDVTVPPVTDDSDGKGRGDRGGKKDKGKDKDDQGDESEDTAEAESEPEPEEEVDPDVYGLPEDEAGDEGDQSEQPVDPEATP